MIPKREDGRTDEELLSDYRNSGSLEPRNVLVERYAYIAEILAKKFLRSGVEYDDLYQVGVLALMKAIDRFQPEMGNKLSTFLTPSVVGELKNYYRDKSGLIRSGREGARISHLIKRAESELSAEMGGAPTAKQIAEHLGIPLEKVLLGMESDIKTVSLDSKISGTETSLYEILSDGENAYQEVENRDFYESCMKTLTEPERKLVELRFRRELSQAETAREFGVSQMFISRLERKILEKLKNTFKDGKN